MCGVLAKADMTRRLFLVIGLMMLMANTNMTDQMKDDAKR